MDTKQKKQKKLELVAQLEADIKSKQDEIVRLNDEAALAVERLDEQITVLIMQKEALKKYKIA